MFDTIKKLLGFGPKTDFAKLVKQGAIILDVRNKYEYDSGHIQGSVNIPLYDLSQELNTLNKNKAFITCCASGVRSASAKSILKANGFSEVYNGGFWMNLRKEIFKN